MSKISFKCDCGKAVSVDAKHAGQRGRCPRCGTLVTIPSSSTVPVAVPAGDGELPKVAPTTPAVGNWDAHVGSGRFPERMRANRAVAGKLCTICQTAIAVGEDVRNCSGCKSSYHAECWEQAGGCGTYGCENSPAAKPVVSDSPVAPSATFAGTVSLPRKPSTPQPAKTPPARFIGRRRSRSVVVASIVGLGIIGIAGAVVARNSGLRQKLSECSSHSGIQVRVYYDQYLSTEDVVFDLREITGSSVRRIDPVHLLLQFGQKLDESGLRRLILARDGRKLMYLERSDVRELTREYTFGNPVWSFNHLPERLKTMHGRNAYSRWEGGWLGVLQKQTEDLNQFISDWLGS